MPYHMFPFHEAFPSFFVYMLPHLGPIILFHNWHFFCTAKCNITRLDNFCCNESRISPLSRFVNNDMNGFRLFLMNCVNAFETGIPPKRIKTSGFHVSFNNSFRKMYRNSQLPSFCRGARYEC